MCGYVCIGCGACGRPKSEMFDRPPACARCGAELESLNSVCTKCGALSTPGSKVTVITAPGVNQRKTQNS